MHADASCTQLDEDMLLVIGSYLRPTFCQDDADLFTWQQPYCQEEEERWWEAPTPVATPVAVVQLETKRAKRRQGCPRPPKLVPLAALTPKISRRRAGARRVKANRLADFLYT